MNATTPLTHVYEASANEDVFAPTRALSRLASIDVLRALIIVVMALDHVRDFFADLRFNPLDPALVVITLYPACRWFGEVKRRRGDWWLSCL